MIPVITLIGLEKVGKSTIFINLLNNKLFNNLFDFKGIKYGLCFSSNFTFLLIDTLSISFDNFNFFNIEYNLNIIISRSDIILFIIDINFLYLYKNLTILNYLRKFKIYIFLIINKFDNNKFYFDLKWFIKIYLWKPYFISTLHNYNLKYFINNILNIYCYNKKCFKKNKKIDLKNITIFFFGNSRTGKSNLINSLINKYFFIDKIFYNLNLKYRNNFYCLINILYDIFNDKLNLLKIYKVIISSNIIIFIIDPIQNLCNLDFKILNFIISNYLSVIFVINKSDLLNLKEKIFYKKYINKKLNIKNFYIIFISSLFNYNIHFIKFIINKVWLNSIIKLNTSKLNKMILKYSNFLKIYYNYNIKVNYIHQGGKNPILIIIHGKINFKKCYIQFLKNIFIKKMNIKSVFLKIKF